MSTGEWVNVMLRMEFAHAYGYCSQNGGLIELVPNQMFCNEGTFECVLQ
jgi:hypothetical protein